MASPSKKLPSTGAVAVSSTADCRESQTTPATARAKPIQPRRLTLSPSRRQATTAVMSGSSEMIMPACEAVVRHRARVSSKK